MPIDDLPGFAPIPRATPVPQPVRPPFVRADEAAQFVLRELQAYSKELDDAHEVGMALVPFGPSYVIHVRSIAVRGEMLLVFHGETEAGQAVALVQHVSQLNFMITAARRAHPEQPKRPIGFAKG